MVLNALMKSSWRNHLESSGIRGSLKLARTAWMIASAPARTPTPTWDGERKRDARSDISKARTLETRRRRTSPTAMGRWPPSFLLMAKRFALQKKIATDGGRFPAANLLTKRVRATAQLSPRACAGAVRANFRCSARNPEGPGAVPFLKDRTAFLIFS